MTSTPANQSETRGRFESLSILFTAMFAVLATGSMPESFVSQLKDTEKELERIAKQEPRPSYLLKIDDYVGIFTRVARTLRVITDQLLLRLGGDL